MLKIILILLIIFTPVVIAHSFQISDVFPEHGAVINFPIRKIIATVSDTCSGINWAKSTITLLDSDTKVLPGVVQNDGVHLFLTGFPLSKNGIYRILITAYNNDTSIYVLTSQFTYTYTFPSKGEVKVLSTGNKGIVYLNNNEQAVIAFKSTSAGKVTVRIYTLNGLFVYQDSYNSSGSNDPNNYIQWACNNTGGSQVSSGIYLVNVQGPGLNITKKVAILR